MEEINTECLDYQFRLTVPTDDLRASLRATGQLTHVELLGPKPYRVVDGFRRIKAARELGWSRVRAVVHDALSHREALRMAFSRNVVRRNLSALERANAMMMAQQMGMTRADLMEVFGLSERQVARYLRLQALPPVIRDVLDGKQVTIAHGVVLAQFGISDRDAAQRWGERIANERFSIRRLRRLLAEELGQKPRGRRRVGYRKFGHRVRVYPMTFSLTAPLAERARVGRLFRQLLMLLEGNGQEPTTPAGMPQ